MMHTTSDSGLAPSVIQRGLDEANRDTIAYLAASGVADALLRRVAAVMLDSQRLHALEAAR